MQMVSSVSRRKTIGPEAAMFATGAAVPRPSIKIAPVRRRSFPAVFSPATGQLNAATPERRRVLVRSRSLPLFGDEFFSDQQHLKGYYSLASDGRKRGSGIDFEILQRCQRPQYATQLHWYHRYRRWRSDWPVLALLRGVLPCASREEQPQSKSQVSPLSEDIKLGGALVPAHTRSEVADTARLHIPNQQVLRAATSDFQSKLFITRIQQLGKVWNLVMLLASVYHLLVTPFKLCFSHEVSQLPDPVLRAWSGVEALLDALCLVDLANRMYYASPTTEAGGMAPSKAASSSFWQALVHNSELRSDVVAMLPLELLLLHPSVRLPVLHLRLSTEAIDASWWITRWALRMNRMLLFRRIAPLSEHLFQFAIHDLHIPVSEALLYFVRELAAYLSLGHLLACIWFVTSEVGLWLYGVSWLSTPGMLAFKEMSTTGVASSHRALQAGTTASELTLESVSLAREYLRSLLFALECISTLFYGDILSMNPLELIVEIGITFWAIYIYGALVGAQGEWLDSTARQEAAFEQNLAELQHFLTQNDVPKGLKRQVKAFFARTWRRHQGKPEFASVANVSRALYEDVVFATQKDLAAQVRVFQALDENFLRGLLVCLGYVVCSEGEEVVSKGDMDRSMYFISQGRVLVRMDAGETLRERGEFFGEFALLYGISRLETCTALSVVELYRLDHEPYEKLLQDFPGYRRRNKQAWTTPETTLKMATMLKMAPILARRMSSKGLDAVTSQNIERELPHTFVYKSGMEMLAQMQTMHPEEAKQLILKCRASSRKRLSRDLEGN